MRLIDADALLQKIKEMPFYVAKDWENVSWEIIQTPTVYDVDKVVDEITDEYIKMINSTLTLSIDDFYNRVVRIIKGGGRE